MAEQHNNLFLSLSFLFWVFNWQFQSGFPFALGLDDRRLSKWIENDLDLLTIHPPTAQPVLLHFAHSIIAKSRSHSWILLADLNLTFLVIHILRGLPTLKERCEPVESISPCFSETCRSDRGKQHPCQSPSLIWDKIEY